MDEGREIEYYRVLPVGRCLQPPDVREKGCQVRVRHLPVVAHEQVVPYRRGIRIGDEHVDIRRRFVPLVDRPFHPTRKVVDLVDKRCLPRSVGVGRSSCLPQFARESIVLLHELVHSQPRRVLGGRRLLDVPPQDVDPLGHSPDFVVSLADFASERSHGERRLLPASRRVRPRLVQFTAGIAQLVAGRSVVAGLALPPSRPFAHGRIVSDRVFP